VVADISRVERANWLAEEDAWALEQPQAISWNDYSHFVFARHPHLQPAPCPEPRPSRSIDFIEFGRRVFNEHLSGYQSQLASDEKMKRVLEGLSADQQIQLAALVIDSILDFEFDCVARRDDDYKNSRFREVTNRRNLLVKKTLKAKKALEDLARYASCELRYGVGTLHGTVARNCLADFDKYLQATSSAQLVNARTPEDSKAASVLSAATMGMVKLYFFFFYGCIGIPSEESAIRVALIRNKFWRDWVDEVKEYSSGRDIESHGSGAVRQALSRWYQYRARPGNENT
jgi:hypothetical protein